MTTIDKTRRQHNAWQPVNSTHRCERHLLLGDVHCGKRAIWRAPKGLLACGGCKQLAIEADGP